MVFDVFPWNNGNGKLVDTTIKHLRTFLKKILKSIRNGTHVTRYFRNRVRKIHPIGRTSHTSLRSRLAGKPHVSIDEHACAREKTKKRKKNKNKNTGRHGVVVAPQLRDVSRPSPPPRLTRTREIG